MPVRRCDVQDFGRSDCGRALLLPRLSKGQRRGHTTGAMFPVEQIDVAGQMAEYEGTADSGNTVTHLFCAKCSTRLFGKNTGMPGVMTVGVGTLNDPDMVEPQVAVFARSRAHWDAVDARVQMFDAQPAWTPRRRRLSRRRDYRATRIARL